MITRRALLQAVASLSLLQACGAPLTDDLPETLVPPEDLVAAWFEGPPNAGIQALGSAFLADLDGAAELDALLAPLGPLDESEAIAALEALALEDLDAERVVVVAGWILSLTEARLCGLAWAIG